MTEDSLGFSRILATAEDNSSFPTCLAAMIPHISEYHCSYDRIVATITLLPKPNCHGHVDITIHFGTSLLSRSSYHDLIVATITLLSWSHFHDQILHDLFVVTIPVNFLLGKEQRNKFGWTRLHARPHEGPLHHARLFERGARVYKYIRNKQTRFILYIETEPRILLEELRKTKKYYNRDRRCLGRDVNREPPKTQIQIVTARVK